ncbi:MAG: hypothetical protein JO345_01955 [Streptosporangiaceae bacterium]|nr:hypothetical protein [Streptosporangiaceae bacterium]
MLDAFYGAFSPACFALLGLWLVVVQMRLGEWQGSASHRRRAYGVALHFVLPGVMSMFALIDTQNPAYWRVSFAVVALGGAAVMVLVRGLPAAGRLETAAYAAAVVLYLIVGVLAMIGGADAARAEASLLTLLVFLGFNAAWLLLFEGLVPSTPEAAAAAAAAAEGAKTSL